MSKPTIILSDMQCPGMGDAVYDTCLDCSNFDSDPTGELKSFTTFTFEWPEKSGQTVWYKARHDGESDVEIIGYGVAYRA